MLSAKLREVLTLRCSRETYSIIVIIFDPLAQALMRRECPEDFHAAFRIEMSKMRESQEMSK